MKKFLYLLFLCTTMVVMMTGCDSMDYDKAVKMYNEGNYAEAMAKFEELGDYKDSSEKALRSKLNLNGLNEGVWFFEAASESEVNVLTFSNDMAVIKPIYYNGNGKQLMPENLYNYKVNSEQISVTLADGSKMDIPYFVNEGALILGNGEYFTPQQVDDGLQGYWGIKKGTYIQILDHTSYSENIYYFDNGTVKSEGATKADYYGNSNEYYYSGPTSGTYTIDENGLNVKAGNYPEYGFVISNGKVVMNSFGDILSVYDGFKGINGYSF